MWTCTSDLSLLVYNPSSPPKKFNVDLHYRFDLESLPPLYPLESQCGLRFESHHTCDCGGILNPTTGVPRFPSNVHIWDIWRVCIWRWLNCHCQKPLRMDKSSRKLCCWQTSVVNWIPLLAEVAIKD